MSYKLKHESISGFSTEVASEICDRFYSSQNRMTGEALMNLTDSKQVNSFLIKGLFAQWQKEIVNLKSPYFNYDEPEVQKALKSFMNTLSNFISVERPHLEPLLVEALADTVRLTFDARDYIIDSLPLFDKVNFLKAELRYFKTHKEALKTLSERMENGDSSEEIRAKMDALVYKFESADPGLFLKELNAFSHLTQLFEVVADEVVVKSKPTPAPASVSAPEPVTETPKPEPQPKVTSEESSKETINDRFNGKSSGLTLAEKLQKSVNQSIEKSLTLNERIMFTNALFGGKKELMSEALTAIDSSNTMQEAMTTAKRYNQNWDMESEEMEAFMQVLERRFN